MAAGAALGRRRSVLALFIQHRGSDLDDLDAAAALASRTLHRPVNIQRVRPAAWAEDPPTDPFLKSVRERPRVVCLLPEVQGSADPDGPPAMADGAPIARDPIG